MKKVFIILGMLLSLGVFCACSNDDEVDSGSSDGMVDLTPIDEGDVFAALSDFFQSNNYHYPGTEYMNFFEGSDENACLVINNSDELLSKYTGVDPFPNVDFNKYTLIVGQEMMPESFYTILRQELTVKNGKLTLNIYVPELDGGYSMIQHLFYWGLYPKIQSSSISVKIIKERV